MLDLRKRKYAGRIIGVDNSIQHRNIAQLCGIVDETALVRALTEGWIAGAGFDVLTQEPPIAGNPLLELDLPNFILLPHVAWASDSAMQALADQLTDNIEAFARGEPKNRVA